MGKELSGSVWDCVRVCGIMREWVGLCRTGWDYAGVGGIVQEWVGLSGSGCDSAGVSGIVQERQQSNPFHCLYHRLSIRLCVGIATHNSRSRAKMKQNILPYCF